MTEVAGLGENRNMERVRQSIVIGPLGLALTACGAGTVTSEDVDPGEAVVIGIVVLVGLLYVGFVGGRGGR